MLFRLRFAIPVLLLSPLPAVSLAQPAPRPGAVTGVVRGAEPGKLIEGARVMLQGTKLSVITGRRGEFAFNGLAPGKYVIQASAIGYGTMSAEIEVKSQETLEVEFEAAAEGVRLPDLAVVEKPDLPAEFQRRSETGGGRYLTRADIERRPGTTLGNLLRSFPGLRVDCRRYPCTLQLSRAPRNCPMAYWLDGAPTEAAMVMLQPARELDGVELYSGLADTPPELYRPNTCGAIAIWSHTPPRSMRKDKKP